MKPLRVTLRWSIGLVAAAASLLGGSAEAWGAPTGLSAIPVGTDALAPASGTFRLKDVHRSDDALFTALDAPVCLASDGGIDDSGVLFDAFGSPVVIVERLITGPHPVLERTRIDRGSVTATTAKVTERAWIRLAEVGTEELPIYAYRVGQRVHLLVPQGFRAPSDAFTEAGRSCGFMRLTLDAKEDSRTWIAIAIAPQPMPEAARWIHTPEEVTAYASKRAPDLDPPSFTVNASISKLSRDPEPLLSITVVDRTKPI